ncbi:5'/3'-nucleotidase SurE [Kushneria sp. EE4]
MALNVLLTNDDGYDAPGIQSLQEALTAAGHNVTVAAPRVNQSAQGSSLGGAEALASDIAVTQYDEAGNYWIDGRPAVAVDTALDALLADQGFDLVVSGTNKGENIGSSENISGTVNGAMAGLKHGLPAIAVSADADEAGDEGFANAAAYTVDLLQRLENQQQAEQPLLPEGTGLSVNVPQGDIDGAVLTEITRKSSTEFPITQNEDGTYGSQGIDQQSSGGLFNEGDQFLDGNITVSAIDGNWGANEQARSALETRLEELLSDGVAPAGDHAPLNVMLVNDGGYEAQGLTTTREALQDAGYDVTVVAPTDSQQAVGSALTLGSFEVTEYEAGYHVDATPSTTVYTGLDALLTGADQPDLIVSGVDDGASVGLQASSSGTLGAAVASVFNYDIPAIAVSAGTDDSGEVPSGLYETSADFLVNVIGDLQATQAGNGSQLLPQGEGLSINVPLDANSADFAFTLPDEANDGQRHIVDNGEGGYRYEIDAPVNTDNAWSEGTHYNQGDITLTPIDGSYQADDATTLATGDLLGMEYGRVNDWSAEADDSDATPMPGHEMPGHDQDSGLSLIGGLEELFQDVTAGIGQLVAQLGAPTAGDVHSQHTSLEWSSGPQHQTISFSDEQYHRDAMNEAFSSQNTDYSAGPVGQMFEQRSFATARDAFGRTDGQQSHDVWHSDVSPFGNDTAQAFFSQDDMLAAMSGGNDATSEAPAVMPDMMSVMEAGQPMLTGLSDQMPSPEFFMG